MRIDGLEAIALDIPLTKDFGGSTYHVLKRSTVITRLRTKDGVVVERQLQWSRGDVERERRRRSAGEDAAIAGDGFGHGGVRRGQERRVFSPVDPRL